MIADVPRVLISSAGSGYGKTTVMIALLSALCSKGLKVQSFKSGPDYIDPMFHTFVTKRKTYHTDAFFSDKNTICSIIANASADADISVIEGAMGFYDGIGKTSQASSFTVANITQTPVLLVINPKGMGISVSAMAHGYISFRKNNYIKGFILNKIKPSMYNFYKDILEKETGLKVFGYLPEMDNIHIKSRHLGLVTADEAENLSEITDILMNTSLKTIDIDAIIQLSKSASSLKYNYYKKNNGKKYRLGIAKDNAFCFYYAENFDMLENSGAEIVFFSPLNDEKIPDNLDGIYLGGGYPELYAEKLSENISFKSSLKNAVVSGMPIFAECGGFMYLQKGIYDKNNKFYSMADILDTTSSMSDRLCRFGYITLTSNENTMISDKGYKIKAHEFHYSDATSNGDAFTAEKSDGKKWRCIVNLENITAGFPHIYFPSCIDTVRIFSQKCIDYKSKKIF
jgi:cobyrinic acid a,c-diamide synthase